MKKGLQKKIKAYAAKKKTSVSKIAEEYFVRITNKPSGKGKSFVEEYAGILKHSIPDIDKARDEYLKEKYGM